MYKLGQIFYAIGFLYENDMGNIHYTALTPENKELYNYKETKLYRLEVCELVTGKNDYTNESVEGIKLKDQYGDTWAFNYPSMDNSGRGMIFSYYTEKITQEEFSELIKNKPIEIREASKFFELLHMYANDSKLDMTYREWLQSHLEEILLYIKQKFNIEYLTEALFKKEGNPKCEKRFVRYIIKETQNEH